MGGIFNNKPDKALVESQKELVNEQKSAEAQSKAQRRAESSRLNKQQIAMLRSRFGVASGSSIGGVTSGTSDLYSRLTGN